MPTALISLSSKDFTPAATVCWLLYLYVFQLPIASLKGTGVGVGAGGGVTGDDGFVLGFWGVGEGAA